MHIYTGDGKGKTTAAFGLALRAAGHGSRVLIFQFLKPSSLDLGERGALKKGIEGITVRAMDEPWDMFESMGNASALERVKKAIARALREIETAAHEKYYDVIILDEIVFCFSRGLVTMEDIKHIIINREKGVEIILTGRGATPELIELADLVTEMKPIKHPFDKGVQARKGIEF
ncbi:MAG: cob(I)yrinic acid a,c-diamide adenosyltransferase [Sedimentisphaerales bacterium]|nr:cob(I)yrinic acid a,c-diamide adenosyltransferase [Sedimentisphaerales bacterium]